MLDAAISLALLLLPKLSILYQREAFQDWKQSFLATTDEAESVFNLLGVACTSPQGQDFFVLRMWARRKLLLFSECIHELF